MTLTSADPKTRWFLEQATELAAKAERMLDEPSATRRPTRMCHVVSCYHAAFLYLSRAVERYQDAEEFAQACADAAISVSKAAAFYAEYSHYLEEALVRSGGPDVRGEFRQ